MLHLITGAPGSSKTLKTIDIIKDIDDRPIYVHGINELKINHIPLNDPHNWHKEVADGSVVVIDEVQKVFGVRPPKDSIPDGVSALETHRHRGIDLYFVTQHPSMLDHHARRLVSQHTHIRRLFGHERATVFTLGEVFDPKDKGELKRAEASTWAFPKENYKLYKSAELHTSKKRIPKGLLLIPILIIFILVMLGWLYSVLFSDESVSEIETPAELNEGSKFFNSVPNVFSVENENKIINWEPELFVPKHPLYPASAPIYQGIVKINHAPKIRGCIRGSNKCVCYSQQSTRILVADDFCNEISEHGMFDIFGNPRKTSRDSRSIQRQHGPVYGPYDPKNSDIDLVSMVKNG